MVSTKNFIISQIIGVFALALLVISFQKKSRNSLIKLQTGSSLLYSLQYLFLGAFSGSIVHFICAVRNVIFYKFEKKVPLKYLIITIVVMLSTLFITYDGLISVLPVLATVLYSTALWKGDVKIIRIIDIICCLLFIAYALRVSALMAFLATIIEMISALVGLYEYDFKPRIKKK